MTRTQWTGVTMGTVGAVVLGWRLLSKYPPCPSSGTPAPGEACVNRGPYFTTLGLAGAAALLGTGLVVYGGK